MTYKVNSLMQNVILAKDFELTDVSYDLYWEYESKFYRSLIEWMLLDKWMNFVQSLQKTKNWKQISFRF